MNKKRPAVKTKVIVYEALIHELCYNLEIGKLDEVKKIHNKMYDWARAQAKTPNTSQEEIDDRTSAEFWKFLNPMSKRELDLDE